MDLVGWVEVGVVLILIWTLLVVILLIVGRALLARELALLVPNLVRLFSGLVRDPRVPLPAKVVLGLASPRTTFAGRGTDRKSTRLNSSHDQISYAVFCL